MSKRWTEKKAKQWVQQQGQVRGCNYLPRSAVNATEMWQEETFDPRTIDEELGWAKEVGLNNVRVFLPYVVWQADAQGFKDRMHQFLEIASWHGIRTMFILFDDCAFSGKQPYVGRQPEPVPGVHNSGWTPSPGFDLATNPSSAGELGAYVKDIIGSFAQDERIYMWDLYNEPGNSELGDQTMWLVESSFRWARQIDPMQPLTTGAWMFPPDGFESAVNSRLFELSDVPSFHFYGRADDERMLCFLEDRKEGRPMLCTEWLLRQGGNTFSSLLPLFERYDIGWYCWGLVAGRTQTYMYWGSKPGTEIPAVWQHDLLHPDGTAFDPDEIELLRSSGSRQPI